MLPTARLKSLAKICARQLNLQVSRFTPLSDKRSFEAMRRSSLLWYLILICIFKDNNAFLLPNELQLGTSRNTGEKKELKTLHCRNDRTSGYITNVTTVTVAIGDMLFPWHWGAWGSVCSEFKIIFSGYRNAGRATKTYCSYRLPIQYVLNKAQFDEGGTMS